MDAFSDPQAVARYAEGPPRLVPGFHDMQRMAHLLLAERAPRDARVLVLGADGGLELRLFAEAEPGWRFDGVDPSAAMLDLARTCLRSLSDRVQLHHGLVDVAPEGPFDAAACLLTLHFVGSEERRRTLRALHRRLRPGAPFVLAHLSFPQDAEGQARWLSRYAAFATNSGIEREKADEARAAIATRLPILSPADDERGLEEAGFRDVELFHAGFAFRGWVAVA